MVNNCHIPDLEQPFPYVENGQLHLRLWLLKTRALSIVGGPTVY